MAYVARFHADLLQFRCWPDRNRGQRTAVAVSLVFVGTPFGGIWLDASKSKRVLRWTTSFPEIFILSDRFVAEGGGNGLEFSGCDLFRWMWNVRMD